MRWVGVLVCGLAVGLAQGAAANERVVLDAVLASWQGDAAVQFVQLRMTAAGQGNFSQGARLVFDAASGAPGARRVYTFLADVPHAAAGGGILVATSALASVAGIVPDFVLPDGALAPPGGRVCYEVHDLAGETVAGDCVAWGTFRGDDGGFGLPVVATPENRALVRAAYSGVNREDWTTALSPTVENNEGVQQTLYTLCGNGLVEQGEQCDGAALAGATCATLGFAPKGTLGCAECRFDTSDCSRCGNGTIDKGEQCDGADLGGRTCTSIGFTGGALACTKACRVSTASCAATFFVPGGGPAGTDCLGEWLVTNATGSRPLASGRVPARQTCRDGDAGCDTDDIEGTCTFTVALCVDRVDARLDATGRVCRAQGIASWTLLRPLATAAGTEGEMAARLLAAGGALGPSVTADGAVTFAPALDSAERCTDAVALVVARQGRKAGKLTLRARTASIGTRRDVDTLRLVCRR